MRPKNTPKFPKIYQCSFLSTGSYPTKTSMQDLQDQHWSNYIVDTCNRVPLMLRLRSHSDFFQGGSAFRKCRLRDVENAVALIRQKPIIFPVFTTHSKTSRCIYIYIYRIISEGRVSIEQLCLAMIPFKLELQGHWMTVGHCQMIFTNLTY